MNDLVADTSKAERVTFTGLRYPDGRRLAVHVAGGRVTAAEPIATIDVPDGVERWIVPGFFDLQVNGFAGRNFTDTRVTADDVRHIAWAVLRTGTTRFLPTVITADLGVMCGQLSVIAEAMDGDPLISAMCPGIHVEGPFIRPEDGPRGAHPREHVRGPSIADYDRLAEAARGKIAMLTLAPELPGAVDLIRCVTERGVVVALGHHRADAAALDAAIRAGARLSTHLGNATDANLPRHDNCLWAQLGEDRLWASVIADGHHLPPAMLRSILRAKTAARTVLITDAIGAAGMPPGRYLLGDTEIERTPCGRVILPNTPYQAGSAADMPTVIGRAVIHGGVSFAEAVTMASLQPASLMSGEPAQWSCEPGQQANLVELDWQPGDGSITIRRVVAGELVGYAGVAGGGSRRDQP